MASRWHSVMRPSVPANYAAKAITFQLLDCMQSKRDPVPNISNLQHNEIPEIRLFGATREGFSVLVHVYNFEPYLWIEAPIGWNENFASTFQARMNDELAVATKVHDSVVRIETHQRQNLMMYQGGRPRLYLKLVTQLPGFVPKIRALCERGFAFDMLYDGVMRFHTFESNVIFPLRYLIYGGISGASWVTVSHSVVTQFPNSTAQVEVDCDYSCVTAHEAVGEYMGIAPLRILSIDIECMGRKGFFPEADKDPVIQIANHVVQYGSSNVVNKTIFTLGTCASIAGAEVHCFGKEEDMLVAWSQYLVAVDPDVLTGYNITGFDFPYLLNRAQTLNISNRFAYWSRIRGEKCVPREKQFQSKQMGNRNYVEVIIDGRIVMDVLVVMKRDHKLRSYSLNSVAQTFLGEQKEDVHHSIIADLQNGDEETRRRLAVYCLKDAYLPIRLLEKLMIIVNNVEMARVTGVPVGWLLERGQGIKVFSQMLRKAQTRGLLFPVYEPRSGTPGIGYEGATVITPEKGFYNCPVATLDFASLYPSIMMAHNLCYSTLLRKGEERNLKPADYTTTPSGDCFVKPELFKGILPEILVDLLTARKQAKKAMAAATDPLEYAVLNGRQLALKISANSVYGFTGATVGKLPCLEISASVTSFGRQMIEETKRLVEEKYPDVHVIYGDTDSVMIRCAEPPATTETTTVDGEDDVKDAAQDKLSRKQSAAAAEARDKERLAAAMAFGLEAAQYVSTHFKAPIKLEFEKVYFPFLLMNKKRYAGLLWTNTDKFDKLDAKGIETVRRDNCPLIASVISGVLNRILIQRSVDSAVEYVKGTISDLLMNRIDISQLVISKAFSKKAEEYQNEQAHIALVERMKKRDAASAPTVGDRVSYVIIKAAKGARAYERSEDPIYVLENNTPIDVQYYLEHSLTPPLMRVFEAVLDDPMVLVKGDHTRHVAQALPSKSAGGLMKFVKVQPQCLACRSNMPNGDNGAVCPACDEKAPDVYANIVAKRNHFEAIYSRVWTQCQQCQGSLHQDVLCSSRDCPVFYMRKKVQKDLDEYQGMLDRFGIVGADE